MVRKEATSERSGLFLFVIIQCFKLRLHHRKLISHKLLGGMII